MKANRKQWPAIAASAPAGYRLEETAIPPILPGELIMKTLSRRKAVISFLCIVAALAVVLLVVALREIWRSPSGGCMVLS